MQDFSKFHKVIYNRIIFKSRGDDPIYQWQEEIKQFTTDLSLSISFINEECSDEELYYLSEVFDDLLEKTKSAELLDCLKKRASLVQNQDWKKDIEEEIDWAGGCSGME